MAAKTLLARVSNFFQFLFETPYNARRARRSEHLHIHQTVASLSFDEILRFQSAADAVEPFLTGGIVLNADVIILEQLPEGDHVFDVTGRLFLFDKQSDEYVSNLPVEMTGILYPNGEIGWTDLEVQA